MDFAQFLENAKEAVAKLESLQRENPEKSKTWTVHRNPVGNFNIFDGPFSRSGVGEFCYIDFRSGEIGKI